MNKSKALGLLLLLLTVSGVSIWLAGRGYGEVSENAYQFATATYGACLAKSPDRLSQLESMLDQPEFISGLTDQEIRWLKKMVSTARADNWQRAAELARQMMEDQAK